VPAPRPTRACASERATLAVFRRPAPSLSWHRGGRGPVSHSTSRLPRTVALCAAASRSTPQRFPLDRHLPRAVGSGRARCRRRLSGRGHCVAQMTFDAVRIRYIRPGRRYQAPPVSAAGVSVVPASAPTRASRSEIAIYINGGNSECRKKGERYAFARSVDAGFCGNRK